MNSIIADAVATGEAAVNGFITSTAIPLWVYLLGIAVLGYVVGRIFGLFGGRRHRIK